MSVDLGQVVIDRLDPQTITLLSLAGLLLGTLLLIIFIYRRLRWGLRRLSKTTQPPFGFVAGLRNLTALLGLIAACGLLLFVGLFFQAYQRLSHEIPVAEIITRPLESAQSTSPMAQVSYRPAGNGRERYFLVHGDQWMIEGDILKWKPWLNLLGLETRYRLTRITGRYLEVNTERLGPRSVLSLMNASQATTERHPLWRFLYRSGQRLPLVDTVYGNAAYQDLSYSLHYQVFVSTTGFVVRQKEKGDDGVIPSEQ